MKTQLIKTVKRFSILLLLITFVGGCTDDDSFLPKIISDFTYTVNTDTGTVTFINTSENSGIYEWDFGDGTTSKEIEPIHTYITGDYTVTLKSLNVAGASAIFKSDISIQIPEAITLPLSFDDPNVALEATVFGGAAFKVVDNPSVSGTNAVASKVGEITNSGAAYEGVSFDLGTQIDLATDKSMKLNFWADTAVDVLVKLEEGTGADIEVSASHGGTGWEEIYFTFTSSDKYSKITIFVDGPGTTAGSFYIDDLAQIATSDIPCTETKLTLPIDFDCAGTDYATKIVGNVSFTVIDNPELSGINATASKVGQLTNTGVNWENAFFNLDIPVDFSANNTIRFKFYSTVSVDLKLKVEDGTAGPTEVDVTHGGTGWEELNFIFTSTDSYNDMILFVDGPGTTAGTFYIDDIENVTGTPPPPACTTTTLELPIDFDCAGTDYDSKRTDGGIGFSVVDNPQLNGVNAAASKVAQIVNPGAQWENLNFNLDTPVSFATDKLIKLKLYSTVSVPIKLKLETGGTPVENDQTHGGTGWEELTFTLATSDSFSNLIIFIDGPGNTAGTFYIDDIKQVSGTPPPTCATTLEVPIDFDCAVTDYDSKRTDGGIGFSVVDNPQLNGVNATASKVAQIVNPGAQWENLNFNLDTPISFATNKSIKLKLYSTVSVPIKLKLETGGTPVENDQTHGGTGWEELTFTLATSDSFSNLIIFIDGPGNTAGTFYIDDIVQVASGGGTGGGGLPAGSELITNGDFETTPIVGNGWLFFPNGGTAELSTTENNGGANSIKLLASGSPAGAPVLKQEGLGVNSVNGGNVVTVTFDIKAAVTQPGAVINVALFSELSAGATRHAINIPATDNTWQTVSVDITTDGGLDSSRGLSIEFQAACGAVTGCNIEMYIDNVSIKVKQ